MLSLLSYIGEALVSIGVFVLNAIIAFINLFFDGASASLALGFSLLPSMPTIPKLELRFLEYANWFW